MSVVVQREGDEMQNTWERILQGEIYPDLEKGRVGWDLEHSQAVVHWARKIGEKESGVDERVVVAAVYGRD